MDYRDKKQTTSVNPVKDNPEMLLQILNGVDSNAKFVIDKMWANVKFFTTITTALLTTSIALYGSKNIQGIIDINSDLKRIIFAFIPIIVIFISIIGMKNLKREYKRFLEWVAVRQKLHDLLRLDIKISTSIYPNDKYLFPDFFLKNDFDSSDDFVQNGLDRKGSLFYYFNILHKFFIGIAIIITLLILWSPLQFCLKSLQAICF
ncbi:MAG: hypothetical protein KAS32_24830 [Candidatus Peribacteraceae bacterium]|nr:hypothetical protein [Candidatus Peribacteraceae bacterium]